MVIQFTWSAGRLHRSRIKHAISMWYTIAESTKWMEEQLLLNILLSVLLAEFPCRVVLEGVQGQIDQW